VTRVTSRVRSDRFSFGITADYDSVSDADLDVFTAGIQRGLADLRDAPQMR
jgi:hypothetical protein